MKLLKQMEYNGEKFIYVDLPRDDVKLSAIRPVSDGLIKVLTVYLNDEVIVRKQSTNPRLTRSLMGVGK